MKRFFVFLVLSLITIGGKAQIKVLDDKTNEPIPYVQIFNNKGAVVGITDINGKIPNGIKGKVELQHICYKSRKYNIADNTNLFLSPLTYDLKETSVMGKKREYIRLKGYYRTYILRDSLPQQYLDAIVEYIIPIGKNGIKRRVVSERSLVMDSVNNLEKKRKFMIEPNVSYPEIKSETEIESLNKMKNIRVIGDTYFLNNTAIGKVGAHRNYISIDKLSPNKFKKTSLFGYEQILSPYIVTEFYNKDSLDYVSLMNLNSRKSYRRLEFWHKKESIHRLYDIIEEFYICEHEYLDKTQTKCHDERNEETSIPAYCSKNDIPCLPDCIYSYVNRMREINKR